MADKREVYRGFVELINVQLNVQLHVPLVYVCRHIERHLAHLVMKFSTGPQGFA